MVIQRFRPSFGGQGVQVENLCESLARRGIDCTVYTADVEGAPAREDTGTYTIRRVPTSFLGRRRCWPAFGARVQGALREDAPDLVHVHGLTDGLYGAWAYCWRAHRPLVFEMTLLGVDEPDAVNANPSRPRWLRRRIYRRADAYVAMSRAFEPSYRRSGLSAERFHVIPQGVDTRRFMPVTAAARAQAREQLGVPVEGPVVAFIGSLIERKGIDILAAAWPRVLELVPGARLLLAGPEQRDNDQGESSLQRALDGLPSGAAETVIRLGRRDDPELVLAAADAFAFPSRREGFGTVIIEAMATGLPCVVARLPGITDFVFGQPGDGQVAADGDADGIVVPQEDPTALAAVLARLLRDPELRQAVGERARARVVYAFDLEHVADQYADLYGELTAVNP